MSLVHLWQHRGNTGHWPVTFREEKCADETGDTDDASLTKWHIEAADDCVDYTEPSEQNEKPNEIQLVWPDAECNKIDFEHVNDVEEKRIPNPSYLLATEETRSFEFTNVETPIRQCTFL
jgi:hypothetical protein